MFGEHSLSAWPYNTVLVSQRRPRPATFLPCGLEGGTTFRGISYNLSKNKQDAKARLSRPKVKESRRERQGAR